VRVRRRSRCAPLAPAAERRRPYPHRYRAPCHRAVRGPPHGRATRPGSRPSWRQPTHYSAPRRPPRVCRRGAGSPQGLRAGGVPATPQSRGRRLLYSRDMPVPCSSVASASLSMALIGVIASCCSTQAKKESRAAMSSSRNFRRGRSSPRGEGPRGTRSPGQLTAPAARTGPRRTQRLCRTRGRRGGGDGPPRRGGR